MFYQKGFLFTICLIFTQIIFAQEIRVIDNKGTVDKIINNIVTTSSSAPVSPTPFKGDIWINNSSTPNTIKIYDGSTWVDITHTGTEGSVFFAGTNGVPTENNAQLFWDNTNNRLYIGSILSGSNKLNVNGTTRTSGLNNSKGTETLPSYRFTDDSSSGMFSPASTPASAGGILGFSTAGVEALRISATQQVKVQKDLHIVGKLLDSNGNFGTASQVLKTTATGTEWALPFNDVENELIFEGTGPNINFYYVSLLINNNWQVIKYDKTDVNIEVEATVSNNPSQTSQPITLAECESLTYN